MRSLIVPGMGMGLSAPDPDTIRRTAREVLQRPEFAPSDAPGWSLEDLLRRLGLHLAELPPGVGWAIFGLFILIMLILVIWLLKTLTWDRAPADSRARPLPASLIDILEGTADNWRDAIHLALEALRRSDLRRSVWIAHRVLLGLMDAKGLIRFAGWKTNDSYLRECSQTHPAYATLAALTDAYEQLIYRDRPFAPQTLETLLNQVARMGEAEGE